jgi:hypothetical protein
MLTDLMCGMERLLGNGTGTPDERIADAKRVIGMAQYDKKLAKAEEKAPAVAEAKAAKAEEKAKAVAAAKEEKAAAKAEAVAAAKEEKAAAKAEAVAAAKEAAATAAEAKPKGAKKRKAKEELIKEAVYSVGRGSGKSGRDAH